MTDLSPQSASLRDRPTPLQHLGGGTFAEVKLNEDLTIQLKLEGQLQDRSIKEKTARMLISEALASEQIHPDAGIIESTSGNLGVSLAALCARLGLPFTAVVDPNSSPVNIEKMRALGARFVMVDQADFGGGYQLSRVREIKALLAENPELYWTNQYDNPANSLAHQRWTGPEIAASFPKVRRIFAAVGTGGTVSGTGRHFKTIQSKTEIIAADVVGSVTFGGPAGPRYISGTGQSFIPKNFDRSAIDRMQYVQEIDAIIVCLWLARHRGILVGGSTGVAIAAALIGARMPEKKASDLTVVISPDDGEKYVSTIFNENWVAQYFGKAALSRARSQELRIGEDKT